MCCILYFPVGASIDYNRLKNCVHNNSHSFGAIIKNPNHKKIEIIRKCYWEDNEKPISPDEVFELIDKNREFERYIHLRWRTDGPIDLDNTHPFPVFVSNKRSVYFMHNGILHNFKPDIQTVTYVNGVKTERKGENISDSKKFVDTFLAPLMTRFAGEGGKGDISDPLFADIVQKYWNNGSKGLLISNDQDPYFINMKEWVKLKHEDKEFFASNNTYFDKLQRGPEYDRVRREEEEARRRNQSGGRFPVGVGHNSGHYSRVITELKYIPTNPREPLTKELKDMFSEYRIWEEEGMASLSNLTPVEIEGLVKDNPNDATNLIIYLTSYYTELYNRYTKLVNHTKNKTEDANAS